MNENRKAAIAAALILFGFGAAFFLLPWLMRTIGEVSPVAAGVVAVLIVAAFFLVFWFRARAQRRKEK